MSENFKSCWVVVEDDLIGTENQCVGVAEALGVPYEIRRFKLAQPWEFATPYLPLEMRGTFKPPFPDEMPDLVISAGRKSVAAARYIKRKSKGNTFICQLQNPRVKSKAFDLIAAPFHDALQGENVITTDGAPNRVSPAILEKAKQDFAHLFQTMEPPRVAVLLGGKSKTHSLSFERVKSITAQLKQLDARLMITSSRRTGLENNVYLKHELDKDGNYFWDGNNDNPYFGMLAWADHILVTEDSVSMVSDAGTTGKPVHIIKMEGESTKFNRFHNHMKSIGVTREFNGTLESWNYEPLNDAQKVAEQILKRRK